MSQPIPPDFTPSVQENDAAPRPSRWRYGLIAVVAALLIFGALAVILNETVFRIQQVAVIGNRRLSWQQVVDTAGISGGLTYFTVDKSAIARAVNSNPYLIYQDLEMNFPNGITLYVQERTPVVSVQDLSATYILADDGMVLERVNRLETYTNMIMVTGLMPKKIRVGAVVVPSTNEALEAYLTLLEEITLQNFTGEVSELNLSETDSLKLVTRNGYTVKLGDAADMRAKIGTLRAVLNKLKTMETGDGYIDVKGILEDYSLVSTHGIIDASVPGTAIYSPPNL